MGTDDLNIILERWLTPLNDDLPVLYAVGGAVRDHFMGRTLGDIDLVCRNAGGFSRLLADCQDMPTTVVPFTRDRRAACYRVVNRRRPEDFMDVVEMRGPEIEADLALRDFTVNALAIRIGPGGRLKEVIDCLGGRQDINHRILRACYPTALADDPLRILRAARLAAWLGFTIDPGTVEFMKKYAGDLTQTASERITAELLKLLRCRHSLPHIRLLDKTGALGVILPEISATKGCEQNGYHHLDVWEHSLETLAACESIINNPESAFGRAGRAVRDILDRNANLPLLKLAALLHDAGKPQVKHFDPERGRETFHGHARRGAEMAASTAFRLRLSAIDGNLLSLLVRHHMRPVILSQPDVKPATIVKWFREVNDIALLVMVLSVADVTAKSGEKLTRAAKDRFFEWARRTSLYYLESLKTTLSRPNLVNGRDLIDLGLPPGPDLGRILAEIRQKQDLGEIISREKALILAKELIHQER